MKLLFKLFSTIILFLGFANLNGSAPKLHPLAKTKLAIASQPRPIDTMDEKAKKEYETKLNGLAIADLAKIKEETAKNKPNATVITTLFSHAQNTYLNALSKLNAERADAWKTQFIIATNQYYIPLYIRGGCTMIQTFDYKQLNVTALQTGAALLQQALHCVDTLSDLSIAIDQVIDLSQVKEYINQTHLKIHRAIILWSTHIKTKAEYTPWENFTHTWLQVLEALEQRNLINFELPKYEELRHSTFQKINSVNQIDTKVAHEKNKNKKINRFSLMILSQFMLHKN